MVGLILAYPVGILTILVVGAVEQALSPYAGLLFPLLVVPVGGATVILNRRRPSRDLWIGLAVFIGSTVVGLYAFAAMLARSGF